MDRLEAMATLVRVADAGSLTAAAKAMRQPLPSVSRRIAELEARLGAKLLIRTTRRLALTEAGAVYVAACRRILDEVEEAERAAASEFQTPRGELVVAAPVVLGRQYVAPILTEFLALFPEIGVRLLLSDRNADLVEDHIDAAVRLGALADSALLVRRLGEVRRIVCASPGYLARAGTPDTPEALRAHALIVFDAPGAALPWRFGAAGAEVVNARARLTVNTAEAALDAALAGAGITRILSYQASTEVAEGRLVRLLPAFEPAPIPVHLMFDGRDPMPLKLRSFLDFAAPRLTARLSLAQAAF
jgi:DNA-binding transcriptional LysR family regulator